MTKPKAAPVAPDTRKTITSPDFFRTARRRSVPIVAIGTLDQRATIATIRRECNLSSVPLVTWDSSTGFDFLNPPGESALKEMEAKAQQEMMSAAGMQSVPGMTVPPMETCLNVGEAIRMARSFPRRTCLFILNANRQLGLTSSDQAGGTRLLQGLMNGRDQWKQNQRTVALLGQNFDDIPGELLQDVALHHEPLPSDEEYRALATSLIDAANAHLASKDAKKKIPIPDDATMRRIVSSVRGLATFPAEQQLAMSLIDATTTTKRTKGKADRIILTAPSSAYNVDALFERQRQSIEAQRGLSIARGGVPISQVGGHKALLESIGRIARGPLAPEIILFIDEIEKSMGTKGNDGTSVRQEMLGMALTWTQERYAKGIITIGMPGVGKSYIAKAIGTEFDLPVVMLSFAEVQEGIVGSSQENLRNIFRTLDGLTVDRATGRARVLMIATCNNITALPPELQDRFSVGTWFADMPTPDEQSEIFDIHLANPMYGGHEFGPKPDAIDLTGRDIFNVIENAWLQGITMVEASEVSVTPIARTQAPRLAELRAQAKQLGYLCTSKGGAYGKIDETNGDLPRCVEV